jgi:hypothetical protein
MSAGLDGCTTASFENQRLCELQAGKVRPNLDGRSSHAPRFMSPVHDCMLADDLNRIAMHPYHSKELNGRFEPTACTGARPARWMRTVAMIGLGDGTAEQQRVPIPYTFTRISRAAAAWRPQRMYRLVHRGNAK